MVQFACPSCKTLMQSSASGSIVACPNCKTQLRVPGEPAPAAPVPVSAVPPPITPPRPAAASSASITPEPPSGAKAQRPVGDTVRAKGNELWAKFTSLPTGARIGILGGAGGILFLSCICCGCIGIFSGKGGGSRSAAVANAEAIKVSASELFQAYQANEVAADQKYKGKVLEVAGDVHSIEKDFLDHIYVSLRSGGQFDVFHVNCYFDDKYTNEAANLSKGKHITVKGRCDGKAAGVNIRNCIFVEK